MIDNSQQWKEKATEIVRKGFVNHRSGSEAVQFATSMLTALYGPESPQLRQFRDGCDALSAKVSNVAFLPEYLCDHAIGVIQQTQTELEAGLIVSVRVVVAGEVLGELIRLAKEILADRTEEAKNTASVLTAAAYEGLMRKMGEEFASVADRRKLDEVITALKLASVLKGGQVGTAQSYLQFRNDSLHADWNKVDRSQVESCLAFVESLLVKHFS